MCKISSDKKQPPYRSIHRQHSGYAIGISACRASATANLPREYIPDSYATKQHHNFSFPARYIYKSERDTGGEIVSVLCPEKKPEQWPGDRKSTPLNSSHSSILYVF